MSSFTGRHFFVKIWIFALISIFTFSSSPVLGQNGSLAKYKRFERETVFINKIDKNGAIYCEEVKNENLILDNSTSVNKLHILPSLNDQRSFNGLKIILRATDQLMQYPEVISAFIRAAARWERVISTPITTVLDVDFGPTWFGSGFGERVLGATATTTYYALKADYSNAMVPDIIQRLIDLKPGDTQLKNLYSAIPIPTPSTVPSNLERGIGTLINLQVLGFIEADISADPNINPFGSVPAIGFNSSVPFDINPSDGINDGEYDFDAVCTHEIGHALGFVSATGFSDHKGLSDLYYPWDLFRVRPEAVEPGNLEGFSSAPRVTTAGPTYSSLWCSEGGINYYFSNHVFFDGPEEVELSTADGEMLNGDGRQSSHWRDDDLRPPSLGLNRLIGIMDPTLPSGTRWMINHHDLRMLEVIGYTINYDYKYTNMLLLCGQDTLNLDHRIDTLKFVNLNLQSQQQVQFQMTNLSLDNSLLYEFEIIFNDIQPKNASLLYDAKSGSVGIGKSETITVSLLTQKQPASFLGTIRIKTNDVNYPIIDIPFELTTGGALAPKIASSINDLGNFSFNTKDELGYKSKIFAVSNLGNLPLNFEVLITLSAKTNTPTRLFKSSSKSSNLEQFFGSAASTATNTLYSTDFEDPNGFGGFTQVNSAKDGWQKATIGPAINKGHSRPTVVHFGKEVDGELSYDNNVDGFFFSPDFSYDISRNTSTEDIICVSFKYFNRSGPGVDIVSLMGSKDSRRTWKEIGSSGSKGLLKTQSTEWETIVLQLPDLTNPLLNDKYWSGFGFRFSSDGSEVDQGFFLDDFEVTILKGLNPIYVYEDWGILPTLNSSKDIYFTINGELLAPGFYHGSLSVISNDYKNSNLTIPFTINNNLLNKATKGILYASTGSGSSGSLLKINTLTGKGADVGLSGYTTLKSISLNPKTSELFGLTYSSGLASVVKIDGLKGWGIDQFKTPVMLSAMAFTSSGDLLGIATPPLFSKFEVPAQRLYKINITNGDVQSLATLQVKAAAMAIEPSTGYIWISVDTTKDKDKIYKINPATGDTTLVGRTGIGNNTIRALAFDNHGNLWGAYGDENVVSTLIKIDKTSGVATIVGITDYKEVSGLAFAPDSITAVESEQIKPSSFALFNNYPNPFNPSTIISYQLPENSFVSLKIYDVIGNEVATLVNELQTAGVKNVTFKLKDKELGSGIYFYQLKTGSFVQTKKMLLLK